MTATAPMNRMNQRRGEHIMKSIRNSFVLPALLAGLSIQSPAAMAEGTPIRLAPRLQQAADKDGWKSLFDGKSLDGWKPTAFRGGGEVRVEKTFRDGAAAIVVEAGDRLSGFQWTKDAPKTD